MRTAFVVAATFVTASVPPAIAQDIYVVVDFNQGACASFSERLVSGTLTADVCGLGYVEVASDPDLNSGTTGCASVAFLPDDESEENPSFVDIGCGPLTVRVDPRIETAHIDGLVASRLFNATTGGFLNHSSIAVDVDWTAKGDPDAGVGESANVFTFPFFDVGGYVVVLKAADADGSIASTVMGGAAGPATDAVIDEGVGLYLSMSFS